jgi:hypothetical protein
MDCYTVMLVGDERSPVRRYQIPKRRIRQCIWGVAGFVLVLLIGTGDYWRLRANNRELGELRVLSSEQAEQIDFFEQELARVQGQLDRVRDFERKVRIIANLPGAAAAGGAEVTELAPPVPEGAEVPEEMLMVPAGVPVDPGRGGPESGPLSDLGPDAVEDDAAVAAGLSTAEARHVQILARQADGLAGRAEHRASALEELLAQLEDKRTRLASLPSIWPARGWLTSRFGPRISPFTGRRQMHEGIDIAARIGTPVVAPADGRVSFAGRKGPLGNTVIIDHGFGVRTYYGHNSELHVKKGDRVERGQLLASIGNSGRSTGPHLHYTVRVNGKNRDPLNYIFD